MVTKVYLFDLDDTLISTKIYAEIYQPVLEMIKTKLNYTHKQLDEKAKELGLNKNRFNRWDTGDLCRELNLLKEYYQILEEQIPVQSVLHHNVIDLFEKLKKEKKKIAIVSNSMLRTVKAYVNKYKLNKYLTFIFSRDDVQCLKDQEAYWRALIKKHKLKPAECIIVGNDEKQDIQIPERLGFQTFKIKRANDLRLLKV